jgi:hypothetical protein
MEFGEKKNSIDEGENGKHCLKARSSMPHQTFLVLSWWHCHPPLNTSQKYQDCREKLPFQLSAILDCAGQRLSPTTGFIIAVRKVLWKLIGLQSVARLAVIISSVSSFVAVPKL